LRIGWIVVFAVTTASSASCGDEPLLDHDASQIPVGNRLQAHTRAVSARSKKYEQLKQVTRERLRSAIASPVADSRVLLEQAEGTIPASAAAALRDCSDLEAKMAGAVLHGAVEDFDRYYVCDQTFTPTHSVNREAL
jgi:hypothetical protein